jgi:hypothetical protein
MILANVRGKLTARDLDLVVLLLSQGSAARREALERRLDSEGPDALLDEQELAERLLAVRTLLAPSEVLFLYVMVRRALVNTLPITSPPCCSSSGGGTGPRGSIGTTTIPTATWSISSPTSRPPRVSVASG